MRLCKAVAAAALTVAFVAVIGGGQAGAQSTGFHVARQRIFMDIQRDGSINVVETLDVDYADEAHHGIYQYFNVRFNYDPNPKYKRVYKMRHIHVTATDASAHTAISDSGRVKTLKIGDAHKTVTGMHTYVISYRLDGALNGFKDHDELYWNPVGFGWVMPIDTTQVIVRAPDGVQRVGCFTGPEGSTLSCDGAAVASPQEADFTQGVLYPGNGMTIVVALNKGVVDPAGVLPILDEKWSFARAFAVTFGTAGAALVLLLLLGGLVVRKLWQTGRDRRTGSGGDDERIPMFDRHGGPVQYRPPDDARPAEVGVLIDERADPLDVTATIIDLGVRGYLSIEETEKKTLFHKADWKLTKTKEDDDSFAEYERRLFEALFDGRNEVSLSDLHNKFASDLHHVQNALYDDTVGRKWFAKRPDRIRATYLAGGIVALIFATLVVIGLAAFTHAALVGVPLVLVALLMIATHHAMPARTGKGSAALDQAMGFRKYMATA
ncbi:MAG TPA: DUF2207 domain-containing protein, partial [Acidimicrobiales bacterium]|nr:DUF2207 domain-containing protein [Acidimicrobiales bacterium]